MTRQAQADYEARMRARGFKRPRYWVHQDDLDAVQKFCREKAEARLDQLKQQERTQ